MHREIHCSFAAWKRKTCFCCLLAKHSFCETHQTSPPTFLVGTCRRSSANGHLNTKGSMVFRREFSLWAHALRGTARALQQWIVTSQNWWTSHFLAAGRVKLLRIWDKLIESSNSPMKRCEKFGFFECGNPPLTGFQKDPGAFDVRLDTPTDRFKPDFSSTKKHHVFYRKITFPFGPRLAQNEGLFPICIGHTISHCLIRNYSREHKGTNTSKHKKWQSKYETARN